MGKSQYVELKYNGWNDASNVSSGIAVSNTSVNTSINSVMISVNGVGNEKNTDKVADTTAKAVKGVAKNKSDLIDYVKSLLMKESVYLNQTDLQRLVEIAIGNNVSADENDIKFAQQSIEKTIKLLKKQGNLSKEALFAQIDNSRVDAKFNINTITANEVKSVEQRINDIIKERPEFTREQAIMFLLNDSIKEQSGTKVWLKNARSIGKNILNGNNVLDESKKLGRSADEIREIMLAQTLGSLIKGAETSEQLVEIRNCIDKLKASDSKLAKSEILASLIHEATEKEKSFGTTTFADTTDNAEFLSQQKQNIKKAELHTAASRSDEGANNAKNRDEQRHCILEGILEKLKANEKLNKSEFDLLKKLNIGATKEEVSAYLNITYPDYLGAQIVGSSFNKNITETTYASIVKTHTSHQNSQEVLHNVENIIENDLSCDNTKAQEIAQKIETAYTSEYSADDRNNTLNTERNETKCTEPDNALISEM